MNKKIKKSLVLLAMTAAAFIITLFGTYLIPGHEYLIFELKDVVFLIVSFIFTPVEALVMIFVVSLTEMISVGDDCFGMLMNMVSSCAYMFTASVIYRKRRNATGLVVSLFAGVGAMTALMLLWNYTMTPIGTIGITRQDITSMLVAVFLPFNLIKSLSSAGIVMLLCGPINHLLKKADLCEVHEKDELKAFDPLAISFAAVVLIICTFMVLTYRNII